MKDKFIIGVVVVTAILLIGLMFGFGYYKSTKDFFVYSGRGGEYQFQVVDFGTLEQYKFMSKVLLNGELVEYNMFFRSSPYDVEGVVLEPSNFNELLLEGGIKRIYVTQDYTLGSETDQDSFMGIMEFNRILGAGDYGLYGVPVQTAFTTANSNATESGIPVVTCKDSSNGIKVIEMRLGSSNKVFMEGDCFIVQGVDGAGLILASDKLAYHLLGVF